MRTLIHRAHDAERDTYSVRDDFGGQLAELRYDLPSRHPPS